MIINNMRMKLKRYISRIAAALLLFSPLFGACDKQEGADGGSVPEGMVEVRPALPAAFGDLPRPAAQGSQAATRVYPGNGETETSLAGNKTVPLPEHSTVWLIARNQADGKLVKNSYVVYNSTSEGRSYLVPCVVNDKGEVESSEGRPLYLKNGSKYKFYAVSPAWPLDETSFAEGKVALRLKNGAYFYAHDCRYDATTPQEITVNAANTAGVQTVVLPPMINQTARFKFMIEKGVGVHDLDIQPSGIHVSGLQNDSPDPTKPNPDTGLIYGDSGGLFWHMSLAKEDEPIVLQHGDKTGVLQYYNYTIDAKERVFIDIPVLPMRSLSKPVIVVFRLKINGVPSSYEMMLNEKDFKAGYSYGYKGQVSITEGVTVMTWQFVSWELDVKFPFE